METIKKYIKMAQDNKKIVMACVIVIFNSSIFYSYILFFSNHLGTSNDGHSFLSSTS